MIDRYQLTREILELVDSLPLQNVDIAPIIIKHSDSLEIEQQRSLRLTIIAILRELKQAGEIEFYEGNFMITVTQAGQFVSNGGHIRSTYNRQSKIEQNMATKINNRIQLETRRNILDSFMITRISWHGNLDQPTFLGRLYNLSEKPSHDARFNTAGEDIYKHMVMNNDWPDEWVFTDSRFNILHVSDKEFLDFICMTIHPAVRNNEQELTTLLEIYTNNLKRDGFTLVKSAEIAGRPLFVPSEISTPSAMMLSTLDTISQEKRKALVIGCSQYEDGNILVNPLNDANGMEYELRKLEFEVDKIIDPSQKELKRAIDEFGNSLKGSDVGLFYFAGHGVQVKGLNYLIPVDAKLSSEKLVEYDCVEAGRILAYMEDTRTSVNLIILDACRNNPFERSWGRGISQRGLATMNAPKGSLIAYSTAPGNTASDGEGSNGLYTGALLKHISSKGSAVNTIFQRVRLEVMEKSDSEQVPWESTSLTSDFYFSK